MKIAKNIIIGSLKEIPLLLSHTFDYAIQRGVHLPLRITVPWSYSKPPSVIVSHYPKMVSNTNLLH